MRAINECSTFIALGMGTKSRRAARELALNVLYQVDVAGIPPEEALTTALDNSELDAPAVEFATELVKRTLERQKEIDDIIDKLSVGWETQRQPAVDRNILRMAICEMTQFSQMPISVTINEAVELAKKFSTEESGRFVNGVLGAYARKIQKDREEQHAGSNT